MKSERQRSDIKAIGYKDDVRSGVTVAANGSKAFDFTLQKGNVRWSDLNTYQGRQLLPKTKAHDLSYNDKFFTGCFQSCHSFQKTMTSTAWDENGWRGSRQVHARRDYGRRRRRFSDR